MVDSDLESSLSLVNCDWVLCLSRRKSKKTRCPIVEQPPQRILLDSGHQGADQGLSNFLGYSESSLIQTSEYLGTPGETEQEGELISLLVIGFESSAFFLESRPELQDVVNGKTHGHSNRVGSFFCVQTSDLTLGHLTKHGENSGVCHSSHDLVPDLLVL